MQSQEHKMKVLKEFVKNPDKKILIYDGIFKMVTSILPEGYIIKDNGDIWLDGGKSNDLILIAKK